MKLKRKSKHDYQLIPSSPPGTLSSSLLLPPILHIVPSEIEALQPSPRPTASSHHRQPPQPRRAYPPLPYHGLAQRHGPIMHLKLGRIPTIVISGADEASEILKAQDHIFCSRSNLTATHRLSYGGVDIAFSPCDHHWKLLRRLCNAEVFSPAKVQSFAAIRREEVDALVGTISRVSARGEAVNLSHMLLCFFNNVLYRVVFGKRISEYGDGGKMVHQDLLREMAALMAKLSVGDLFPSLRWLDVVTGWRAKLDNCFRRMDQLFDEEIEEHLKSTCTDAHENFLDALLHLQAKKEDTSPSMNEIKAILMNMLVAGTDTSPTAVEWGMAQLMRNQEAKKKATEEVRRAAGDKGSVEERDLQYLHYLKQVIKETLRLSPPSPLLLPRECMQDTRVAGYDIPAKTMVYVNAWAIGRDRRHWPDDPEAFRPERFEGSPVNYKGGYSELIPFGAGRRICPGISLAMAGIELVLANILCCFDWELPRGMTEEDVDMRCHFGIVAPKKVPLILLLKPLLLKPSINRRHAL